MFQATVNARGGKALPSFAFAKPARPPRLHADDQDPIQAKRAVRSLPHEALLWLAPYLASLTAILAIGN